jgi:class 3 adenylate cyclase/tetratricopeptide (TPR) repeat protein
MADARKIVTIVFADVTGSTSLGEQLDAEALRRVLERYFIEMRAVLERHGGTVEKFIGDAVMAAFGIPAAHEDDALRAVRAAAEMRARLTELNEELARERGVTLAVRTGINTGEVVAGDPAGGQFYASGNAVNVAARLEQAAEPGEILLGEQTYRLVRDAVRVEALAPLTLKGKHEAVLAYCLLDVIEGAPPLARRFDTPFVGRAEELAHLLACFARSVTDRIPVLVTVLGPAGIGKTRLAAEFTADVQERATVLQGRCLSYGEGITFWPLEEIVRNLPERPAGVPDPERAGTIEETFFAYRKLFEALAQERPLTLVLEDIHWAEATLLDLIEHIVEWTEDAPLLIVCLARPEFLDERPGWPGARLELEPLPEDESERIVSTLAPNLDAAARTRAAEAAEGNPLFLEQLLALAAEDGDKLPLPHTIQALLAARLDRLEADERALLDAAAVVGKEFWRGALLHLSPPGTEVSALLQRLMRKRLIAREPSALPGEDAFRFGHILVRDAAYSAIAKEARAELHERFAAWLEQSESSYDEIVGYHLEQAYRLRADLGPVDEGGRALAARATEKLASAGHRAWARGDVSAAINLFERASDICLPDDTRRFGFAFELGDALFRAGRLVEAETLLARAVEETRRLGREDVSLLAALQLADLRRQTDPQPTLEETLALARRAVEVFEATADDRALVRALGLGHSVEFERGHFSEALPYAERALRAARRMGDIQLEAGQRASIDSIRMHGPMPLDECIPCFEETLRWAQTAESRWLEASALFYLGDAAVEQGRPQEGNELRRRAEAIREELGQRVSNAIARGVFQTYGELTLDADALEARMRTGYEVLKELGEKGVLSTVAADLAQVLYWRGKYEEAEALTIESEALGAEDDVVTQVCWRATRAMALARRGEVAGGEALAREAVTRATVTEYFSLNAESHLALGEVLRLAGRAREASHALEQALGVYESKGCALSSEAVRARLTVLHASASS